MPPQAKLRVWEIVMLNSKTHNIWKRTIAIGMVCLFLVNQVAFVHPAYGLATTGLENEDISKSIDALMQARHLAQDDETDPLQIDGFLKENYDAGRMLYIDGDNVEYAKSKDEPFKPDVMRTAEEIREDAQAALPAKVLDGLRKAGVRIQLCVVSDGAVLPRYRDVLTGKETLEVRAHASGPRITIILRERELRGDKIKVILNEEVRNVDAVTFARGALFHETDSRSDEAEKAIRQALVGTRSLEEARLRALETVVGLEQRRERIQLAIMDGTSLGEDATHFEALNFKRPEEFGNLGRDMTAKGYLSPAIVVAAVALGCAQSADTQQGDVKSARNETQKKKVAKAPKRAVRDDTQAQAGSSRTKVNKQGKSPAASRKPDGSKSQVAAKRVAKKINPRETKGIIEELAQAIDIKDRLKREADLSSHGPDALPFITDTLRNPSSDLQHESLARTLVFIGPSSAEALIPVLKDDNAKAVMTALEVLGEVGNPVHIKLLIPFLKHDDSDIRQRGLVAVGKLSERDRLKINCGRAVPAVAALFEQGIDSQERYLACNVLIRIGPPALPVLIRILSEGGVEARRDAAAALGLIGDEQAKSILLTARENDEDEEVRQNSARALRSIAGVAEDNDRIQELIRDLKSRDLEKRRIASTELGKTSVDAAVDPLIAALHDENMFVRADAVRSLGLIGDERAVPHIIEFIEATRELAADTGRKSRFKADCYTLIWFGYRALGQIGGREAVAYLTGKLNSENPEPITIVKQAVTAEENDPFRLSASYTAEALIHAARDLGVEANGLAPQIRNIGLKSSELDPKDEKNEWRRLRNLCEVAADGLEMATPPRFPDGMRTASSEIPPSQREDITQWIRELRSEYRNLREVAKARLIRQGEPAMHTLIETVLSGKEGIAKDRIVEILREYGQPAVQQLMEIVTKGGGNSSASAAVVLGQIGEDAAPVLIAGLSSENATVRKSCVIALAEIDSAAPELAKIANEDENAYVREVARTAGDRDRLLNTTIYDDLAKKIVCDGLDPCYRQRNFSYEALSQTGKKHASALRDENIEPNELIIQAMADADTELSVAAAYAFGSLARTEDCNLLIAALGAETRPAVRRQIIRSLGKIGSPKAADILARISEEDGNDINREEARIALRIIGDPLEGLRGMKDEEKIPVLVRKLDDRDDSVLRTYTVRLLEEKGDEISEETIRGVLEEAGDSQLLSIALRIADTRDISLDYGILRRLAEHENPNVAICAIRMLVAGLDPRTIVSREVYEEIERQRGRRAVLLEVPMHEMAAESADQRAIQDLLVGRVTVEGRVLAFYPYSTFGRDETGKARSDAYWRYAPKAMKEYYRVFQEARAKNDELGLSVYPREYQIKINRELLRKLSNSKRSEAAREYSLLTHPLFYPKGPRGKELLRRRLAAFDEIDRRRLEVRAESSGANAAEDTSEANAIREALKRAEDDNQILKCLAEAHEQGVYLDYEELGGHLRSDNVEVARTALSILEKGMVLMANLPGDSHKGILEEVKKVETKLSLLEKSLKRNNADILFGRRKDQVRSQLMSFTQVLDHFKTTMSHLAEGGTLRAEQSVDVERVAAVVKEPNIEDFPDITEASESLRPYIEFMIKKGFGAEEVDGDAVNSLSHLFEKYFHTYYIVTPQERHEFLSNVITILSDLREKDFFAKMRPGQEEFSSEWTAPFEILPLRKRDLINHLIPTGENELSALEQLAYVICMHEDIRWPAFEMESYPDWMREMGITTYLKIYTDMLLEAKPIVDEVEGMPVPIDNPLLNAAARYFTNPEYAFREGDIRDPNSIINEQFVHSESDFTGGIWARVPEAADRNTVEEMEMSSRTLETMLGIELWKMYDTRSKGKAYSAESANREIGKAVGSMMTVTSTTPGRTIRIPPAFVCEAHSVAMYNATGGMMGAAPANRTGTSAMISGKTTTQQVYSGGASGASNQTPMRRKLETFRGLDPIIEAHNRERKKRGLSLEEDFHMALQGIFAAEIFERHIGKLTDDEIYRKAESAMIKRLERAGDDEVLIKERDLQLKRLRLSLLAYHKWNLANIMREYGLTEADFIALVKQMAEDKEEAIRILKERYGKDYAPSFYGVADLDFLIDFSVRRIARRSAKGLGREGAIISRVGPSQVRAAVEAEDTVIDKEAVRNEAGGIIDTAPHETAPDVTEGSPAILRHLKKGQGRTVAELAQAVSRSPATIVRDLRLLEEADLAEREDKAKGALNNSFLIPEDVQDDNIPLATAYLNYLFATYRKGTVGIYTKDTDDFKGKTRLVTKLKENFVGTKEIKQEHLKPIYYEPDAQRTKDITDRIEGEVEYRVIVNTDKTPADSRHYKSLVAQASLIEVGTTEEAAKGPRVKVTIVPEALGDDEDAPTHIFECKKGDYTGTTKINLQAHPTALDRTNAVLNIGMAGSAIPADLPNREAYEEYQPLIDILNQQYASLDLVEGELIRRNMAPGQITAILHTYAIAIVLPPASKIDFEAEHEKIEDELQQDLLMQKFA